MVKYPIPLPTFSKNTVLQCPILAPYLSTADSFERFYFHGPKLRDIQYHNPIGIWRSDGATDIWVRDFGFFTVHRFMNRRRKKLVLVK